MWLLTNSTNDTFYCIKQNEEITVGRSSEVCQLVLSNDSSISRKHAIITTNTESLLVKDLASRYGTFVNEGIETKTPIGQDEIALSNNDEMRFGILNNVWKIEHKHFVTCTSTLRVPDQVELSKQLKVLNGTLRKEWDDTCEYLTMSAITLTVKVICALVHGSSIVTPKFWEQTSNAVNKQLRLPDAKDFIPPVSETTLECDKSLFLPCSTRKTLLKGKKFIFFSRRQLNLYKYCIESSGGSAALLSECKMSCSKLCQRGVIVIQYATNNPSQDTQTQETQINDIVNYLEKKSRRLIPEPEISLAFLYKSLDKYCNPESRHLNEIEKVHNVESIKPKILVPETQEISVSKVVMPVKNIEESLVALSGKSDTRMEDVERLPAKITRRNKRKISEDSGHVHTTKKLMLNSKDPENDLFDFVDEPNTKNESKEISPPVSKKLTFIKVTKPKKLVEEIDDDMFNFVEEPEGGEKKQTSSIKKALNTVPAIATNNKRGNNNASLPAGKRFCTTASDNPTFKVTNKSLIRDKVIQMLKEASWVSAKERKIKTENENETDSEETLEAKMQDIDLGSTLIKTNNSLIKRNTTVNAKVPTDGKENFKKFKKVHSISADLLTASVKLTLLKPNVTIFDSLELQDSDNDEDDLRKVTRKGQKGRNTKVKY